MKKLALLGGAAGAACALFATIGQAADHFDSPASIANKMADIGDLYTWMTPDANNVIFAMTVSPADDGTQHFGPSVQYVFHAASHTGFGSSAVGQDNKVVCTFASDTSGQCWVMNGTTVVDYVKGDFSATAGVTSKSGKVKVFAGHRADPFFFNLGGTVSAIAAAELSCGGGSAKGPCPPPVPAALDGAGCMKTVDAASGSALRTLISTKPNADIAGTPCDDSADIDCFKSLNVMAIVVQVDKTELVDSTNEVLSVWASTHVGS